MSQGWQCGNSPEAMLTQPLGTQHVSSDDGVRKDMFASLTRPVVLCAPRCVTAAVRAVLRFQAHTVQTAALPDSKANDGPGDAGFASTTPPAADSCCVARPSILSAGCKVCGATNRQVPVSV